MAASTSNAAHSNNNSCYDVFISHRGPDVKKTFASYLYRRLFSFGLRVFLDYQELQKGEDFLCEIKGAIKTASVHIAIFSPTYADSQWCLDELVLMLETTAPIIPVFYHVEPTELGTSDGEGVYATSLRNLEKERKRDSDQPRYDSGTIEKWRNALSRVADRSGFDLDLDLGFGGDEGELLDQLVEVVLKNRKKKLDVAQYPTGLDDLVEDFETKLSLQQHGERVQFVGITGLGGAGKTTLAKELFNRKSSRYSKCCFLVDVREKAKSSIPSLQRKLLKDLFASDKEPIDSKDDGIDILRRHFSALSAPVLLVLDDVDRQDQVYALLPLTHKGLLTLPPSSLILITSRDTDVLTRSGVQKPSIYKLTGLSRERSRELFCSHAFCQPHPLSGFEHLVDQFLEACSGLPLSLKVFGGLLCGNTDKSYWKEELKELRKALHEDIQKSLQVSYDALRREEQQIFLDIACFFIGKSRDTAIRVWDASGWNGSHVFRSLYSKCLVETDIGESHESVEMDIGERHESPRHSIYLIRMHDHLRDMGRALADSSGFPCRLWCGTKHLEDLLQLSSEATKVRGIRTSAWEQYDERQSFSRYRMKNLQLLDIEGIKEDHLKCLLEAVDSPNLLWFRWAYSSCFSLPPYIPMENLRVLEVEGGALTTLWQGDVQAPLKLRELLVFRAPLSKIPTSIGQLKHLERMVVVAASWCSRIVHIPKEFCDLRSLKHLVLKLRHLSSLPDSFGNLSRLEHIDLSSCSGLKRLPDSFGNLINLKYLDLKCCRNLILSSGTFGKISTLAYIDLSYCDNIKVLPSQIAHQLSLEKLHLQLRNLKEWPSAIGEPSGLERLVLETPLLQTLPPSFGCDLMNLKHLELRSCRSLRRLPDSFLLLDQLIKLIVEDCSLQYLHFNAVEGESERLTHSEGQGTVSNLERCLLRLQHLELHKTQISEISFPNGVCNNLQYLDIRDCQDLVEVGTLPNALIKLQLIDCPKLRTIERLSGFAKLRTLGLRRCKEVEELPSIGDRSAALAESTGPRQLSNSDFSFDNCLLHLQHLELHNTAISEVSFPTGVCPNLQYLDIKHCQDLVEVGTLPNALIKLHLIDCPKLRTIERLSSFAKLQTLGVTSQCKEVDELSSIEDKSVALAESTGPRELSNSDFSFDSCLLQLQHLELHNTAISDVLYPTGVCPNLQYLDIKNCQDLVEVGTLPNTLIKLQLTGCPKLRKLGLDVRRCKEVAELLSVKGKSGILSETSGQRTSCNLDSSFDKCLIRLQHLELYNTEISEVSFPAGVYPNLQYLSIEHGISVVKFVTSTDCILRKLDLWNCSKLRKIEELSALAKLQVLSIAWCGVEELSSIETLGSLENLQVVRCSKLKSIGVLEQLTKLRELNVSYCSELEDLPGVEHLRSLEKLWACGCKKLKSIRGSAQLTQLRELDVSECSELEQLPGIEHLRSLDKLWACNCVRLKHIQGLAQLTQLRELDVSGCSRLEEMPGVGYLQSLVWLRASECLKLQSMEGLEQMAQLQELEVSYCFDLEELLGVEHMKSLIKLRARSCRKLKRIQGLAQLTQLRELDVSFCSELEEMTDIGYLQSLVVLRGSECVKLKSLYWSSAQLTHILELDVSGCSELEEIPSVGYLQSLMVLRASECVKLKSIHGLEHLTRLLKLDVSGCSGLEELGGVGHLMSLNMLRASGCVKLKSIQFLEHLAQLLELHVCNCFELEELRGIEHLKSLKGLLATNCKKLKRIKGLEQVTQLQYLDVSGCYELEEIPDVGYLQSLVVLRASECVKLKNIQGLEQMTQLRELDVSYCLELDELPDLESLKCLMKLQARFCTKLKRIKGLAQLAQLQELDVSFCPELEERPDVECLQ